MKKEQPFVIFDDVYKSFDGKAVLKGLNLSIRKRELLVILGGSGTGKTVLLKHVVGLLLPDRGEVILDGKSIFNFTENELLEWRRRVGFLFQGNALFDSLSVFENVAFPLREHTSLSEKAIEEKVHEKLKMVGLEGVDNMMPDKLSGGMRKRVALARAIVMEPEALLYDEPTTGLDPITTKWVIKLIRNVHERLGITSVVVTHNVQSIIPIADRIAFLYRGRIQFLGTPKQMARCDDHMVQEFLKS